MANGLRNCSCLHEDDKEMLTLALNVTRANAQNTLTRIEQGIAEVPSEYWAVDRIKRDIKKLGELLDKIQVTPNCLD